MRQAIHIFKKDALYLRREIALVWILAAVLAWIDTRPMLRAGNAWWLQVLPAIAIAYLIGRLIHAEAIPGDHQFWITRPYRWQSLLAAKLLFIAAFVQLPILAAHLLIVVANGFPFAGSVPGLLWLQMLIFLALSLPFVALGALTAGLAPFTYSMLALLGMGVSATVLAPALLAPIDPAPDGVRWVRWSIVLAGLGAVALAVLYQQYRNRSTTISRTIAVGGGLAIAAAYFLIPWSTTFAVQSRWSKQPIDPSSIQVSLDPSAKKNIFLKKDVGRVMVNFPVTVTGVPIGLQARAETVAITLEGHDGRGWKSDSWDVGVLDAQAGATGSVVFHRSVLMDRSFFNAEREGPVTLRASLFLTVFSKPREAALPLQERPVNVTNGLQCYLDLASDVICRSIFRWPALLGSTSATRSRGVYFSGVMSYSPFPAGLAFDPLETAYTP